MRIRPVTESVSNNVLSRVEQKPNKEIVELHKPNEKKIYKGYYKTTKYDNDFRECINDAYRKRWSHDDFDWNFNVKENLKSNLDTWQPNKLLELAKTVLPLVPNYPKDKLQKLLETGLPKEEDEIANIKENILNVQVQALKEISHHALVAEQSAVAPLSTSIVDYRRYPPVQEACTLFVADEARHSSVFERYLLDKVKGQKFIYKHTVRSFDLYRYLARVMPGASVFLALSVEVVGGAFFEFFGMKCPDPLLRKICETISSQDEKRHMLICRTLYKIVHNPEKQGSLGKMWENFRNRMMLKVIADDYKQQLEMIQATKALGIDPRELINYIGKRLKEEFAHVGFEVPDSIIPKYDLD